MRGGIERIRSVLPAALLAMLAACSSTPGPAVSALHNPPQNNMARIVLLYPAPVVGSNGMVQVKWNDKTSCDLDSGSFLSREIPPETESMAFSFCGVRGASAFNLKAEAGHTYYLRVLPYDSSIRGIMSGYPSEFDNKMEGVVPKNGPLQVERIGEDDAFKALVSLVPPAHS